MITNLKEVDPQIVAGREVEVVKYRLRNYRLHNALEQGSRLLLFCLECDSNNTSSKSLPSDTKDILDQWVVLKDEFEFGVTNNDLPTPSHEYAYEIYLPTGKEIQRIRNAKMKRIVTEFFNTFRTMVSVDSANAQAYVDARDVDAIRKMFDVTDKTLTRWVGDGSIDATGFSVPAFERVGEVRPDVDGDYATILEPSSSLPKTKLPDVADTPLGE